jgi:hypothetical protein
MTKCHVTDCDSNEDKDGFCTDHAWVADPSKEGDCSVTVQITATQRISYKQQREITRASYLDVLRAYHNMNDDFLDEFGEIHIDNNDMDDAEPLDNIEVGPVSAADHFEYPDDAVAKD